MNERTDPPRNPIKWHVRAAVVVVLAILTLVVWLV